MRLCTRLRNETHRTATRVGRMNSGDCSKRNGSEQTRLEYLHLGTVSGGRGLPWRIAITPRGSLAHSAVDDGAPRFASKPPCLPSLAWLPRGSPLQALAHEPVILPKMGGRFLLNHSSPTLAVKQSLQWRPGASLQQLQIASSSTQLKRAAAPRPRRRLASEQFHWLGCFVLLGRFAVFVRGGLSLRGPSRIILSSRRPCPGGACCSATHYVCGSLAAHCHVSQRATSIPRLASRD